MKPVENFYITHDPLDGSLIEPPPPAKTRRSSKEIIAEVAAQHNLTAADLIGRSLKPAIVAARREAMRRVYEEQNCFKSHVARLFDNRDHSAVYWALRGGRRGQKSAKRAA